GAARARIDLRLVAAGARFPADPRSLPARPPGARQADLAPAAARRDRPRLRPAPLRRVAPRRPGARMNVDELDGRIGEGWGGLAPVADDETAVRLAAREATLKAVRTAVRGRDPDAAARLVAERDSLKNPFYGGD